MFFYRDFFYVIINIFFGYSCAFKLCNVVRNYVITLLCNYVILSLIRGENYIKKICAKKNNYIICAVKKLHKKMIEIKKGIGEILRPPRPVAFFPGPSRFRLLDRIHPKPAFLEESMHESIYHLHDL